MRSVSESLTSATLPNKTWRRILFQRMLIAAFVSGTFVGCGKKQSAVPVQATQHVPPVVSTVTQDVAPVTTAPEAEVDIWRDVGNGIINFSVDMAFEAVEANKEEIAYAALKTFEFTTNKVTEAALKELTGMTDAEFEAAVRETEVTPQTVKTIK